MTIRLTQRAPHLHPNSGEISLGTLGPVVARADTREEAERAKRAFDLVLAPRFTRDEAIAIVKAKADYRTDAYGRQAAYIAGIRLALEALAEVGAFSDCDPEHEPDGMRAMLNAAGIR